VKVALAQINPTVGDVDGNARRIAVTIRDASSGGADLVVFPELAITGYPPKDLLLRGAFVERNLRALDSIAAQTKDVVAIVGYVAPNTTERGKPLFNAAAVCAEGRIVAARCKSLLPEYDVFDERRYFEPGRDAAPTVVRIAGAPVRLGVSICEDLWNDEQFSSFRLYGENPVESLAAGSDLLINIAASPYNVDKQGFRLALFGRQVRRWRVPLVAVNQVGGNDDLVFDGGSLALNARGELIAQAKAFEEDLCIVDLGDAAPQSVAPYPAGVPGVYRALVLGTRDYVRKCGLTSVVVGLSGGVDSAVTAAIAVAALGPEHVHAVAMPSRYSSDHSLADAAELADNLGVHCDVIPIEAAHRAMEDMLSPQFAGLVPGVAEENLQARVRGNILMALSNKFGWLVLSTGNKSEWAMGYCTLYGDMCGGLAVLSDVPKTMVYELAEHVNAAAARPVIPRRTITKPPSAELRPNQTDQDTLPPYGVLDGILQLYVEEQLSPEAIIERGYDAAIVRDVARRVDVNEYKRKQGPIGLKVTTRAFGTGRRMPVAAKFGGD